MVMDVRGLRRAGVAAERKHSHHIREYIGTAACHMTMAGHHAHSWSSDAVRFMAEGGPFAACDRDTPEGRVSDPRSSRDGMDVTERIMRFRGRPRRTGPYPEGLPL